jgi:predicted extracellular nuclease
LTIDRPIRVGAPVTFTKPVIIDYRNNAWKFQPTEQLTADNDAAVAPATFADTREDAPRDVGGDLTLASFNVLNYFTETGADYEADGGSCEYFDDREGNPIGVDDCGETGPRGAANDANLARQQAKIVNAINTLDADVLSLEEIENSAHYGPDRDAALSTLVDALNADAGTDKWSFVPSPDVLPASEDVIRTAFIYQGDVVEPVGDSEVLVDAAFANARAPLAQAFKPLGGPTDSEFVAIVNHFKSKSSGSGLDADQNDGQGASNHSRTLQATALVGFADDFATAAGTDKVFLLGDFNAYTREDPMEILYAAGYKDLGSELAHEETYLFGGVVGSLDHVLASSGVFGQVVDADVWNINSVESVALEYSRYNYNATLFYDESPFRSSDHDPLIAGVDLLAPSSTVSAAVADTTYGTAPKVDVTVTSDPAATGRVQVREGARLLGSGTLNAGTVSIKLGRFALKPGTHELTVDYLGNDEVPASSDTVSFTVAKVTPTMSTSVAPAKIVVKKTKARVSVTVSSDVVTPSGKVQIVSGGTVLRTAILSDAGRATLKLPVFTTTGTKVLRISYLGDDLTATATTTVNVKVVKK